MYKRQSELTSAFAYGWVENQVSVATKLVPIGQSDAQRILESLFVTISDAIELDLLDDELGQSMPGLAILSSWHEKQTTRLFRS